MSISSKPILVQPYVTTSGKPGWRWTCKDHKRHRGHHQFDRFTDWVRERNGKEPDDHPFVRCMRGATQHWHKLHAPEHHCCMIQHREKGAPDVGIFGKNDDRSDEEKEAWKAGEFTEEEAREAGQDRDAMNKAREEQERELGNPLAPPES